MVPIRGFVLLLRSSWTSWFPIFLLRIPMKMHEVNEVRLSLNIGATFALESTWMMSFFYSQFTPE